MTDAYTAILLKNINDITAGIDNNALITKTRAAVLTGIKSFQATPAEKAKLYANFEMQFSVQVVTKIIDAVMNAGLIEQQIEVEKQKAQLLTQQKLTEVQQTSKVTNEVALLASQKAMVDQQQLTEVQQTSKVTNEVALLASNKLLVDAQKLTQDKQKLDVMASINLKNWQVEGAKQSALFEESRRQVLVKSTEFNNQIQKAKEENALINALAIDDAFVILDSHLLRSRNAMDAINTSTISYTSGINLLVSAVDYNG